MSTPVFLVDPGRLTGATVLLDGAEGRHAAVVRRLRPGERVDLADGAGAVVRCEVAEVSRARLLCAVLDRHVEPPPQPRVVVVQALPKGDRGPLAVELLTEVGVDVIVPWAAARCVARWRGDRPSAGLEKWRATAREASKQARRAWLPEVRDLAATDDVVALLGSAAASVVLHESASGRVGGVDVPDRGDVVVVVGPEGGLTDAELAAFTAAGATPVRLGPSVLRTSTAGVVAATVLLLRTSRWA